MSTKLKKVFSLLFWYPMNLLNKGLIYISIREIRIQFQIVSEIKCKLFCSCAISGSHTKSADCTNQFAAKWTLYRYERRIACKLIILIEKTPFTLYRCLYMFLYSNSHYSPLFVDFCLCIVPSIFTYLYHEYLDQHWRQSDRLPGIDLQGENSSTAFWHPCTRLLRHRNHGK